MDIVSNFKNGLYLASNSFNILWRHKKLIIYLGIPIVIKSILDLLIYNLYVDPSSIKAPLLQKEPILLLIKIAETYGWGRYIMVQLINFIFLLIFIFESMVLTIHVNDIYLGKPTGVRKSFVTCGHHISKAITWTTIVFFPLLLQGYVKRPLPNLLALLFFLLWSLLTAFVIQAITIDKANIISSIKKSIIALRLIFVEYIGTLFWIGLIALLSATPFLLVDKFIYPMYPFQLITILSYTFATILSCVIPTTYIISKTLLYQHYKEKKTRKNKEDEFIVPPTGL